MARIRKQAPRSSNHSIIEAVMGPAKMTMWLIAYDAVPWSTGDQYEIRLTLEGTIINTWVIIGRRAALRKFEELKPEMATLVARIALGLKESIKAGRPERLDWPGNRVQLSWEVYGGVKPPRAVWLIDHETGGFSTKFAYDDFGQAIAHFDALKREHAVAIAVAALRIGRKH